MVNFSFTYTVSPVEPPGGNGGGLPAWAIAVGSSAIPLPHALRPDVTLCLRGVACVCRWLR
jgi:hypothetical protein